MASQSSCLLSFRALLLPFPLTSGEAAKEPNVTVERRIFDAADLRRGEG